MFTLHSLYNKNFPRQRWQKPAEKTLKCKIGRKKTYSIQIQDVCGILEDMWILDNNLCNPGEFKKLSKTNGAFFPVGGHTPWLQNPSAFEHGVQNRSQSQIFRLFWPFPYCNPNPGLIFPFSSRRAIICRCSSFWVVVLVSYVWGFQNFLKFFYLFGDRLDNVDVDALEIVRTDQGQQVRPQHLSKRTGESSPQCQP